MRTSRQLAGWSATVDFLSDEAPPAPRAPDPRRGRWTGAGRSLGDLYAAAAFLQDEGPSGECSSCGTGPKADRGGAVGVESGWSAGGGADPHARLATPNNPAPGESGASAEDWISNEDEAQNDAVNEALEALAQGKYAGDIDQFWEDLESIEEDWEEASWREPDPVAQSFRESVQGIPLNWILDECEDERQALHANENDPACAKPDLSPVTDGAACPESLLPSTEPSSANLSIEHWDWGLQEFVYFGAADSGATKDDVDFLVACWNWLASNVDLAVWAVCLIEGPENADCVRKRLTGVTHQSYAFVDSFPIWCPSERDATLCTDPLDWPLFGGGETSILVTSNAWGDERDEFVDPATSIERKMCILTVNAAVLLHEMLHSCLGPLSQNLDDLSSWWLEGLGIVSANDGCYCDHTDMVESTFAWAVAQRYPCIAASGQGCAALALQCFFMTPCDFGVDRGATNCHL